MAPRRLSNELLDDPDALAGAYGPGVSIADLADLVGVSAATVRRTPHFDVRATRTGAIGNTMIERTRRTQLGTTQS